MSLKSYFPDFVAVDDAATHWLLEAKGQENIDMIRKDDAALRWCENAFKLTGTTWRYV
jgi:type III restriction enzyme